MKKHISFLLFVFFIPTFLFANDVVSLVQLGEEKKNVGDEIELQVSNKDEKKVNSILESIESNYILPYIYVYRARTENGMLFLDGIVTNLNEKYQPVEINKKVILFNITNEHIDKTQIELPEDYLFNFSNFDFTEKKILYYFLSLLFLLSAMFFFYFKIYPQLQIKKRWKVTQENLLKQVMQSQHAEDLERVYKERKMIMEMFTYNKNQFEALLSLIERNQYMKSWKQDDLEKAKTLVLNLNFNKKKYSGN